MITILAGGTGSIKLVRGVFTDTKILQLFRMLQIIFGFMVYTYVLISTQLSTGLVII